MLAVNLRKRLPLSIRATLSIALALAFFTQPVLAVTFNEYTVPTGASGPESITSGPDGNLWFTEAFANKIGKVTTSGSFTEYGVPTAGSVPDGITVGPDGNIWFTELDANKIGKVTTNGAFTEYTVPTVLRTGSSFPSGI